MSKAHTVAQHLPYLRRYARALTGSQTSGDAYVAATLEALVKEPELLETEDLPRVTLFRLFSTIWNSLAVNGAADPVAKLMPARTPSRPDNGQAAPSVPPDLCRRIFRGACGANSRRRCADPAQAGGGDPAGNSQPKSPPMSSSSRTKL